MATDLWRFKPDIGYQRADVDGMKVEASDGEIGKVESVVDTTQGTGLILNTGPWILGRKVLLPAGVVRAIDVADARVKLDRTKDEIESAPALDDLLKWDEAYQEALTRHYAATGGRA